LFLTTDVPNKKTLYWRGEAFRDFSIPFEAVVGLSGHALVRVPGDEGFADFVNWRWLARF